MFRSHGSFRGRDGQGPISPFRQARRMSEGDARVSGGFGSYPSGFDIPGYRHQVSNDY